MFRRVTFVLAACALPLFGSYVVEWSAHCSYDYATAFAVNKDARWDVNDDSLPEVFVNDGGSVKVFSGVSHSLIWTVQPGALSYLFVAGLANTDGDAAKELVVYSTDAKKFYVYDCASHNLEYTSPARTGTNFSCAVADIDGDGKSEICWISGSGSDRTLEVYGSTDMGIAEDAPGVPVRTVAGAMPNPTQDVVQLSIRPDATGPVVITDVTGRIVRKLNFVHRSSFIVHRSFVVWDCCDEDGRRVARGTYLFGCGGQAEKVVVR